MINSSHKQINADTNSTKISQYIADIENQSKHQKGGKKSLILSQFGIMTYIKYRISSF